MSKSYFLKLRCSIGCPSVSIDITFFSIDLLSSRGDVASSTKTSFFFLNDMPWGDSNSIDIFYGVVGCVNSVFNSSFWKSIDKMFSSISFLKGFGSKNLFS